jgi:MSHA biogenesis protein MshQ
MKHLTRFLLATVLAWLAVTPASWAQTYTATADATTQAAYPWIDISTTGTQLPLADDDISGDIALGFNFAFGSTTYTTVNITANGMLQFGAATSGDYENSALPLTGSGSEPNIDAAMLPLWDDLNPNGNGSLIRYRTIGTSPSRIFVVSWLAVPYYCSNTGSTCNNGQNQTRTISATFQVQVHEQGHFVYRYGVVDGSGGTHTSGPTVSNPLGAVVGHELTNSDYVQYSFRTASVPNNRTILWQRPGNATTPGGFNTFDTGTASGSITGFIRTKIAGTAFNLAVAALNSTRTAVLTTFTGDVRVELLDTSDNSGALNATTGCRATWTSVLSTSTLNFASGDAGRDTIAHAQANSWRDVRVRVSYPAVGTATIIGCSTDNFAIRPASFANLSATDTDPATAGTSRTLNNIASTGGNVHKAGRPFTVRATAVNAAATPATTTNYTGTPTAFITACSGAACTATLGTLTLTTTATAGVIHSTTASYTEAGAFNLQFADSGFASVDAADGSTAAEMTISSAPQAMGRFVPDHFDVVLLLTPVLRTFNSSSCTPRSFTYLGQPFGYATPPQATVLARNAAGATTTQYPNAKLSALTVAQTYTPLVGATPGLDSSTATLPSITANGNGTALLATQSSDRLTMVRPAATPLAPFNASIALSWAVTDNSEAAAGNGSISTGTALSMAPIAFDQGSGFRFGMLKLGSAYGSELINLAVPLEVQYWNGSTFVTNTDDQCTALPTSALALGPYRGNLAACETAAGASSIAFTSGRGLLRMLPPGTGNAGSTDVRINLSATASGQQCSAVNAAATPATTANMPWLQGKSGAVTSYTVDPRARISFGQYRSPLIHLREVY